MVMNNEIDNLNFDIDFDEVRGDRMTHLQGEQRQQVGRGDRGLTNPGGRFE